MWNFPTSGHDRMDVLTENLSRTEFIPVKLGL
jgi:hypothetical protein